MTSHESSSLDGNDQSLTILVDTSQKDGRLLLFNKNNEVVLSSRWSHPQRHTEQLLLEFKKVKTLLSKQSLKQIVFISGPGSFTGLRVGASFVKSLGFAFKGCPIYCITSFRLTAVHVVQRLKVNGSFSVLIPSIGNMAFRSDYRVKESVFQSEKIHINGASEYKVSKMLDFSPNIELHTKFSSVAHVRLDDKDYTNALVDLDQNKALSIVYTHLDLYPLYLRKSEAEEKYSYDKVKL